MKFADRVKQTTTSTGAASIALSGSVSTFRAFAAAFAVGDTGISLCMDDGKGNWEIGAYTLTSASVLTRTAILSSSSSGAAVTFPSGVKEVFCTVSAKALEEFARADEGVSLAQLPALGALADTDLIHVTRPGNGDFSVTGAVLKAFVGSTTQPGDTTAPTVTGAAVANATPSRIDITFSESLANSVPPASAFTVSGGKTVSSVSVNGNVASVTVNSAYVSGNTITVGYTQPGANPRIQDAAGNLAATFSGRAVTNNIGQAATVPAAPTIGAAVAGDGYVDVAFTRNSNGGSAVLDSTATLSTGETATGTTSPIRVTAANGTARTATVRDRNAVGSSNASAASNSVTPQAAGQTQAQKYNTTELASFSGLTSPFSFQGGAAPNQYFNQDFKALVRAADGTYPAAGALKLFWLRTATNAGIPSSLPAAMQFTGGAWPGSVPYTANGGSGSGSVPNSFKGSTYFNQENYPAVFSLADTLYGGGAAGDYYPVIGFPDGSFNVIPTKVVVS